MPKSFEYVKIVEIATAEDVACSCEAACSAPQCFQGQQLQDLPPFQPEATRATRARGATRATSSGKSFQSTVTETVLILLSLSLSNESCFCFSYPGRYSDSTRLREKQTERSANLDSADMTHSQRDQRRAILKFALQCTENICKASYGHRLNKYIQASGAGMPSWFQFNTPFCRRAREMIQRFSRFPLICISFPRCA